MTGQGLESYLRKRGLDPDGILSRTGKMLYRAPSSIVLTGIYFQGETKRKRLVIVHPFVTVLSVQRGYRALSYGARVRNQSGAESFDLEFPSQDMDLSEILRDDLLPFVAETSDPESAIRHILKPRLWSGGLHRFEDLAHLYLWTGRIDEALECLQHAIWDAELGGHRAGWVTDLGHRCLRLYRLIHWDRATALERLRDWAQANAEAWRIQLATENSIVPRGLP